MYCNISNIRVLLALVTGAWATASSSAASGAPFVHEPITLPSSQWALGLGLGVGHVDLPAPFEDITGLGLNLELKGGLTSSLQLGLRTGIRLGSEGRLTRADQFGRAFETETYGTGIDSIANPEISLRQALLRSETAGLALEGRLYLPLEDGTELGIMVALPLHLHLSDNSRFDSGIYVPIFFTDPASRVISFPFHLWFQANDAVAVGVLTGIRLYRPGSGTTVPLGFGVNYAISEQTDLRTWFLFPNVKGSDATRNFGLGLAFQVLL